MMADIWPVISYHHKPDLRLKPDNPVNDYGYRIRNLEASSN